MYGALIVLKGFRLASNLSPSFGKFDLPRLKDHIFIDGTGAEYGELGLVDEGSEIAPVPVLKDGDDDVVPIFWSTVVLAVVEGLPFFVSGASVAGDDGEVVVVFGELLLLFDISGLFVLIFSTAGFTKDMWPDNAGVLVLKHPPGQFGANTFENIDIKLLLPIRISIARIVITVTAIAEKDIFIYFKGVRNI
jgi:hypothetical protein